jgi:hypothetical protein
MTLGNISKEVRRQTSSRATVLLGYIPVSKLKSFQVEEVRKIAVYRLFHDCMRTILKPLINAGRVGVKITCADNFIRWIFPILAAYIADHPERCLVACCKENRCPECVVERDQRGEQVDSLPRDHAATIATLDQHRRGEDPYLFDNEGLRAVYHPFWADLPHTNIFECMAPDILHQLHKGVFKDHFVQWCTSLTSKVEIDARFKSMTDHQGLRHFDKGISSVSQWTGKELKEMARVFIPVLAGLVEPDVLTAARGLLDFIYYAQYQSHTDETLARMQEALSMFHAHKDVFIEHGIREHFNIPKLHSMLHYIPSIRSLGSADGFNTESPERLHIDCAKSAYRASNRGKDYYQQMTKWLQRQEAVDRRANYLDWLSMDHPQNDIDDSTLDNETPPVLKNVNQVVKLFTPSGIATGHAYRIPKKCSFPSVAIDRLCSHFGATNFVVSFQSFLNQRLPQVQIPASIYDRFDVHTSLMIMMPTVPHVSDLRRIHKLRVCCEISNNSPRRPDSPAHFDTALLVQDQGLHREKGGLHGAAIFD